MGKRNNKTVDSKKRYDNRILGKGAIWSNDSRKTGLNSNIMILGTSGCGKTGSILYHNLKLLNEQSAVICDSKGTLYKKFHKELQDKGYDVQMINMTEPSLSTCGWNPMDYLYGSDGNISQKNVLKFAESLLPLKNSDKEPVWMQGSQCIWQMITDFCLEALPKEDHNIPSLIKIYHSLCKPNGMAQIEAFAEAHPDSLGAAKYAEISSNIPAEKMMASYYGFINGMVNNLGLKELDYIFMNDNPMDFEKIGKTKTALFIVVPDTDHTMDVISTLLYSQIIQTNVREADMSEDGTVQIPIQMFLDDFANTCIPDFDMIISVTRSRDIGITIMIQSISQLITNYGSDCADSIINNIDSIVFLGNNDLKTAQYIGTRADKTASSILCMDRSKEYILVSGQKAILAEKLRPYCDEETITKQED